MSAFFGYNLFPDEKGTESYAPTSEFPVRPQVTTYSPMKRGLKEKLVWILLMIYTKLQPIPR